MTQRIVFVDPAVSGAEGLLASIADDTIVVWLDRGRDGVLQITEALAGLSRLDSIEILSHGAPGSLQLGTALLDRSALAAYGDAWSVWRAALAPQADILLYGCNIADSVDGAAFISALAELTGADVAASTDLTGAGGDWILEGASGSIETGSSLATDGYAGTLDTITGTDASETLTGTSSADTITGGLGNDTLLGGGGSDTAVFAGPSGEYRIATYGGIVTIADLNGNAGFEGTDYLHHIEVLRFADRDISITGGGEIRANTYHASTQYQPAIAVAGNGTYMVTWSSYLQDGSGYGIYAQRFTAAGTPAGPELRVNSTGADDQYAPAIASFTGNGGGYVVVWQSDSQDDGLSQGVYAQLFNLSGAEIGNEFRVNQTTEFNQYAPSVAALTGGGFVVSWTSQGQDDSGSGVYARRFNASGVAQSGEIQVNSTTASTQDAPVVATLGGGGFVVAWTSFGQDGSSYGVYAQRFDSTGTGQGEFRVAQTSEGAQWQPSITRLADGGFLVAWLSQDAGGYYDIYARRYGADGTAAGGEFRVSPDTAGVSYQNAPSIAALSGGGFVVGWYGTINDVYGAWAQRYNAAGASVGQALRLDSSASGFYNKLALAGLDDNTFVGVWDSFGLSSTEIIVQRYDASGTPSRLQIDGTSGNDRIDVSGTGDLRAVGGDGDDTYVVNGSYGTRDIIVELANGGEDTVEASVSWTLGANLEHLRLTFNNAGTGNALANRITGASFYNNVLAGLGGNDTLDGGSGHDLASYATAPSSVTVDLSLVTPQATGGDGTDTLIGIEGAIGTNFADTFIGDGNYNAFYGRAGADTMSGGAGGDTLDGGTGIDLAQFTGAIGSYRFGISSTGHLTLLDTTTFVTDYVRDVETLQFADRTIAMPLGGQTRVNTTSQEEQDRPDIALLADGSYVIAWSSQTYDQDSESTVYDIHAQRFSASGAALGGEVRVNTTLPGDQDAVAVAALAGGGFVVTWSSEYQDGSGRGIYAQRFGAGGAALGDEFAVTTWQAGDQRDPAITALGNGFAIAWESDGQDGFSEGIYVQRFGANGNRLGDEIAVNTFTSYEQEDVAIVQLDGGGFLVSWQSWGQDDSGYGVFARRFAADGTPLGGEFQVNGTEVGSQLQIEFTALEGGGFVGVWQSYDPLTYATSIFARRYAEDGTAMGGEWRVSPLDTSYPLQPVAAALAGGGFVISWTASGAVYAQRYSSTGVSLGTTRINQPDNYASGTAARIAVLPDGGFLVTWDANDDWDSGVFVQRVGADGQLLLAELQGTAGADRLDIGGDGDMQAAGLGGNDTYVVDSLGDRLVETASGNIDTVEALISWTLGAYFEHLRLLDGAFTANATGNGAANQITGNSYANVLDGRAGPDTLDGGFGNDTAAYTMAPDSVVVSLLLQGVAQNTGGGGTDTLISIENLIGSAFADQLSGDAQANMLSGGAGRDTLIGGEGNDTLIGDAGRDLVPFTGFFSDYRFGWSNGLLSITDLNSADGNDGTDYIHGVERIRFADRDISSLTGGEIRVNTQTVYDQSAASLASLADGGTVVVWQSRLQDGSDYGIYGQRYDAEGTPLGVEFRINTLGVSSQHEPVVAGLAQSAGGGFVVAWTSNVGDGEGAGIFAQRFDNAGTALGAEFRVNSYVADQQTSPAIAALSGGGFVITWMSYRDDGSSYDIYAQRFTANGTAVGGEFLVNTTTTLTQEQPTIAALGSGGFVIAWTSGDGDDRGIYVQRFDAAGTKLGVETRANTDTVLDQSEPDIVALSGGGFIVVWQQQEPSGGVTIHLQRFGGAGAPLGELQVNTHVGYDSTPSIAALTSGGFVVVWSSDRDDGGYRDIYAQRFSSGGVPLGAEFLVNTTTGNYQDEPSVTGLADGGFAVSWTSYQDGSEGGVYLQRFDATGNAVLMEIEGSTGNDRIDLGGAGNLQATGGAGDDTYVVDGAGDRLIEGIGQGFDTVEALGSWTLGANFELLRLLDAGGNIDGTGTNAADTILGNIGANVLEGRGGDDLLDGEAGSDTASYAGAAAAVSVNLLLAGAAQNTQGAGADTLLDIENLTGSAFGDTLTGDALANRLDGGGGDDLLRGNAGDDTLVGGAGADVALFAGNSTDYRFGTDINGVITILHLLDANLDGQPDQGFDTLHEVETLRFADRDIVLRPGGETRVNTTTANEQTLPSVAVLNNGSYVVTWQSYAQDGSGYGVYAQRYAADGAALGAEFRVNSFVTDEQQRPVVAALAGGGFVVVWQSYYQDGSGWGLYAQRYSAGGVAQGEEFVVNTYTSNSQYSPSVVGLSNGSFVVAWTSSGQDGWSDGVYARRFSGLGAALDEAEFRVNTAVDYDQRDPSIIALEAGGFVVSWSAYLNDGSGFNIRAQRYAANGSPVLGEFGVNSGDLLANTQQRPASAALDGGGFVVVWESDAQDGSGWGIYGQRFNATGGAVGGEFRVNEYTSSTQYAPAVTALVGGGFVVTWQSYSQDGYWYGIYAQRYAANGTELGEEFRVNDYTTYSQAEPSIAAMADGGFVVSWQSEYQDGSGNGIYTQRFDANGARVLVQIDGTAGDDRFDLGGAGDMQAVGGAGDDTYVLDSAGDRAIEAADGDDDTIEALISWTLGGTDENIENLTLGGDAPINGTGNDGANVITGNERGNVLEGGLGNDIIYGRGNSNQGTNPPTAESDIALYRGIAADYLVKQTTGFVIVTDNNPLDGDTGTDLLVGIETLRFLDQDLNITDASLVGEFGINADAAGSQTTPALAPRAGGGLVAAWASPDGTGNGTGIYLQLFEAVTDNTLGPRLLSADKLVNTTVAGTQANPAVATLTGGDIVVVWESTGQDGSLRSVHAQRFNAAGEAQGNEFRINTTTSGEQKNASVAALNNGGFVVAWESENKDGSSYGIVARTYDSSGTATSGEVIVNPTTANAQLAPAVSALGNDGFMVTWESATGDASGYGILARRFTGPGDTSGVEIQVNGTTTGDQRAPAIAVLENGGAMIVWQSGDGGGTGIYAQRYDASGNAVGSEFRVNTHTALDQSDPDITALSGSGGFVVSWTSTGQDGDLRSVHAQIYNASGVAVGTEFRVNTTTVNEQFGASVSALGNGFVIGWQSFDQDATGGYGIFGKGFTADGTPIVPPIIGTDGDDELDLTIGDVAAYGLKGNDTYFVDSIGDVTIELQGEGSSDTVVASLSWSLGAHIENLVMVGASNIGGTGNGADNAMGGNDGNNTLRGNGGNDSLAGGQGVDLLFGGSQTDPEADPEGSDTLDGGAGIDSMEGGLGDDFYYVDDAAEFNTVGVAEEADSGPFAALPRPGHAGPAAGGTNIDTVIAQVSFTLRANIENLQLAEGSGNISGIGNELNNILTGNEGDNALEGQAGIDLLGGGAGDDTLDGGTGADTMAGGLDDDVFITDGNDELRELGGEGFDTVRIGSTYTLGANFEGLELSGGANLNGTGNIVANRLTGNTGNNRLFGLAGNDTLDGGAGADTLTGGANNDTYYVGSSDTVVEAIGGGIDTVITTIAMVIPANVEVLELGGGDNLAATGNAAANQLRGNSGANTLNGMGGADTMAGGAGNDTYVTDGLDQITELGGEGFDLVRASASYTLGAELEYLILTGAGHINGTGNTLDNTLTGNGGNNTLNGRAGADTMSGGAGDDTYVIDAEDTVIEAVGAGNDTVRTDADFTLGNNIENLVLSGNANLRGTGSADDNSLTGNGGANTLDGGAGDDTMSGGAGDDEYHVDDAGDELIEAGGEGQDTVFASVSWTLAANLEHLVLVGGAALNGVGNALKNTIGGTDAANRLDGGSGDDTLGGGAGNDTLIGGGGTDSLAGGFGDDTYEVDAGDTLVENIGEGNDLVRSAISFTLAAEFERLTLTGTGDVTGHGNTAANVVIGNGGDNSIVGVAGNDTLTGNAGNDTLRGGAGIDSLTGGAGDDSYFIDSDDTFTEAADAGTDTIIADFSLTLGDNFENLTLNGNGAIDATGNAAANVLTGNDGANVLDGKAGADTMRGGKSSDTYFVTAGDVVEEDAAAGQADTVNSFTSWTLGANFEHLALLGAGNDAGVGNAANNRIDGNAGNNTLDGGAGADILAGGVGNDTYVVDSNADVVTENAAEGSDTVQSSVSWTLGDALEKLVLTGTAVNGAGNAANNTITGNAAANVLSGAGGNDTLTGGAGSDTMTGGAGSDTYVVTQGDSITEQSGQGSDTVRSGGSWTLGANIDRLVLTGSGDTDGRGNGTANRLTGNGGSNQLVGLGGNDTLDGGIGGDTLDGGNGNDSLLGAGGADHLLGGVGNDTLKGGIGNDTLDGGDGNDVFAFDKAPNAGTNLDTVTQFANGADLIQLDDDVFDAFDAGVALTGAQLRVAAGATTATTTAHRLIFNTSDGALYYDADGNAAGSGAVQIAVLGTSTLAATDFVIVA